MRLLALLFALVTTPALAQGSAVPMTGAEPPPSPRFLVVPLAEGERARIEPLYTALEAAGAESVGRAARAGVDLPLAPALHRDAILDEPREALLSARAALRELALDVVDTQLDEALAHALRLPNPAEHRDLLGDILLMRAELSLARGLDEGALADLRLLARVDPRREELHPGLFSPKVVATFAMARERNAEADVGYLTLQGDEEPLTLLVDGSEVPIARARVGLEMRAGPHLITLRAPGRVSRSFLVEIRADEPLSLEGRLFTAGADEARAEALVAVRDDPGDDAALTRLLAASGATTALVLEDDGAFAYAATSGRVRLDAEQDPLALARAALVAVAPPPVVDEATPTPPDAPPAVTDDPDIGSLALGGGVVLGALVVVAIGGVALAWALQPAEPTTPLPRPVVLSCCGRSR